MSKIIDAQLVYDIKDRKILFDTNVWILIEGLNGLTHQYKQNIYTEAKKKLIENKNVIVVNEYVISEFCNRSAKMDYNYAKSASGKGSDFMSYKEYRGTEDFKTSLEVTRDTCLNIVEECEFCSCYDRHFDIKAAISELSEGLLDLTDIILRGHCSVENYILMSDDRDYAGSNIELITANKRLLAMGGSKSS